MKLAMSLVATVVLALSTTVALADDDANVDDSSGARSSDTSPRSTDPGSIDVKSMGTGSGGSDQGNDRYEPGPSNDASGAGNDESGG